MEKFIKSTDDWMYKHFHGTFSINAVSNITIGIEDLTNTNGESAFSKLMHSINYALEKKKSKKPKKRKYR